jgi:CSLREA domain-containing protein
MNPLLVNSAADNGDGTCDASCTLRDAVLAANAAGGSLVDIEFDASVFASAQTINLGSTLPDITGSVDVIGTGANRLNVRRNSADPYSVFTIDAGAKASLSDLTVSNGRTSTNGFGGGIHNAGTLTLARIAIDGNEARFGGGGGIYNNAGTLTIDDSTISNNLANDGAGLYNSTGFAHLTNTTISGNDTASHSTGGITNLSLGSGPAVVSLLNSTIANNNGGSEGGIYTSFDAVTKLKNTIVAGNSSPNITGTGVGSIASLGNNLADDNGAGFLTGSGDLINLPAMLAPLAYNGGPTKTHDPLVGSPAAFAGNRAGAPLTDQRGYPRLATSIDIGAVESDVLFRDDFDLNVPHQDYVPAHCAAVASTLDIYWEEVDGAIPACIGIEHTDGSLADAADGIFSMNGVSVTNACLGTAQYSFTLSPDKHTLSGSDTLDNVPMTLTLSSDGACFVGHWTSGSDDFVATIWNFAAP